MVWLTYNKPQTLKGLVWYILTSINTHKATMNIQMMNVYTNLQNWPMPLIIFLCRPTPQTQGKFCPSSCHRLGYSLYTRLYTYYIYTLSQPFSLNTITLRLINIVLCINSFHLIYECVHLCLYNIYIYMSVHVYLLNDIPLNGRLLQFTFRFIFSGKYCHF